MLECHDTLTNLTSQILQRHCRTCARCAIEAEVARCASPRTNMHFQRLQPLFVTPPHPHPHPPPAFRGERREKVRRLWKERDLSAAPQALVLLLRYY